MALRTGAPSTQSRAPGRGCLLARSMTWPNTRWPLRSWKSSMAGDGSEVTRVCCSPEGTCPSATTLTR
jgi:hypothetical protein